MRRKLLYLVMLGMIFLSACGKSQSPSAQVEEKIHSSYLLYTADGSDADAIVGTLYMQQEGSELREIAPNVLADSFIYDNRTEAVLYLDADHVLYRDNGGDEGAVKIADNVAGMQFAEYGEGNVVFNDQDGALYVASGGTNEKIGSGITNFRLKENVIYYVKENGSLISYDLESHEEKTIESEVNAFDLLDETGDLVHDDNTGDLFYKPSLEADSIRIGSKSNGVSSVKKVESNLYFMEAEELYVYDTAADARPEKLASDVRRYEVNESGVTYLTANDDLYKLLADSSSKRIATDIYPEFQLTPTGIVYRDQEGELYEWLEADNAESLIGSDVELFNVFSNGQIFYLTADHNLYEDNIKLGSDVSYYSPVEDSLVFLENDELYLIHPDQEKRVLGGDLSDFSAAYYQNNLVYDNVLAVSDITGIWEIEDSGSSQRDFFEITADGKYRDLVADGDASEIELIDSTYDTIIIHNGLQNLTLDLDESSIQTSYADKKFSLKRSSQTEVDKYLDEIAELEKQEEQQNKAAEERAKQEVKLSEATSVVERFFYGLSDAVNMSEFLRISEYIDFNSDFYAEQSNYVTDMYKKETMLRPYDFNILDYREIGDGRVQVRTREVFDVYFSNGDENRSEYEAVYILNNRAGEYLIEDLEVQ